MTIPTGGAGGKMMNDEFGISQRTLSVAFGDSSPRGRAKRLANERLCGTCNRQSLSPFGEAPFAQGSLIRSMKLNSEFRIPNSEFIDTRAPSVYNGNNGYRIIYIAEACK